LISFFFFLPRAKQQKQQQNTQQQFHGLGFGGKGRENGAFEIWVWGGWIYCG